MTAVNLANWTSVPFRIGGCGLEPPSSLWRPVRLQWSDLSPTKSLGNTRSPLTTSRAVHDESIEL